MNHQRAYLFLWLFILVYRWKIYVFGFISFLPFLACSILQWKMGLDSKIIPMESLTMLMNSSTLSCLYRFNLNLSSRHGLKIQLSMSILQWKMERGTTAIPLKSLIMLMNGTTQSSPCWFSLSLSIWPCPKIQLSMSLTVLSQVGWLCFLNYLLYYIGEH